MQTTMLWESTAYSPETLRLLEIQKNMALHSLKTRVNEARLDLRTRLGVLEHDRRQFERRYAKSVANCKETEKEHSKDKYLKLFTQSFDSESIKKWVVRGRHFKTLYERQTTMPVRFQKSTPSVTEDPETEQTEPDVDAADDEVQLPTITITTNPGSAPSAVTFITEMSKARHESPANMSDLPAMVRQKSSVVSSDLHSKNTNLTENEIYPVRSRSYSLPAISPVFAKSSAPRSELPATLQPEAPKVRCFGSNDIPTKLITRRSSNTYSVIRGGRRKSSGGLSLAKVISNMGHGVMYTDLEERQRTIVSDEDWEQLQHCRYLRKPRTYEGIDEETVSVFE